MKDNRTSNKHDLLAHALTLILTKVIMTKKRAKWFTKQKEACCGLLKRNEISDLKFLN
jgi:hypothetical protein